MSAEKPTGQDSFDVLRQFARRRRPVEVCEMCSAELAPTHPHLLEPRIRKLICACDACTMLFSGQGNSRYKRVPRRIRMLTSFHLTDAQWDSLMIPINMAFFYKSSADERVLALYPSPAGATESLLTFENWQEIVAENPVLDSMESDVEALLVNRIGYARGAAPPEFYLLPIDECFKLVGIIRTHWRGLSGGAEVWQEIGNFFSDLKVRAGVVEEAHA